MSEYQLAREAHAPSMRVSPIVSTHKEISGATLPSGTTSTGGDKTDLWAQFGEPVKKGSSSMMHGVNAWVNTVAMSQLNAGVLYPCTERLPAPREPKPPTLDTRQSSWQSALEGRPSSRNTYSSTASTPRKETRFHEPPAGTPEQGIEIDELLDHLHDLRHGDDLSVPKARSRSRSPMQGPMQEPMPSLMSQWQSPPNRGGEQPAALRGLSELLQSFCSEPRRE